MSGFVDRENEIFTVLQRFREETAEFIVVGGYGVSAYQHRFSVDADIVLPSENLDQFIQVLEDEDFGKETERELDVYSGRYLAYVKERELPVTIDLLVDELQCRQTGASWSYEYFDKHAVEKQIEGSERAVQVRVPEEELLIAVKLHSGRVTDARDAVALFDDVDTDRIRRHMKRGDREKLRGVLKSVEDAVSDPGFEDSFKGVFSQQGLPETQIQQVRDFLTTWTKNE